jgi:hypothetical protein
MRYVTTAHSHTTSSAAASLTCWFSTASHSYAARDTSVGRSSGQKRARHLQHFGRVCRDFLRQLELAGAAKVAVVHLRRYFLHQFECYRHPACEL